MIKNLILKSTLFLIPFGLGMTAWAAPKVSGGRFDFHRLSESGECQRQNPEQKKVSLLAAGVRMIASRFLKSDVDSTQEFRTSEVYGVQALAAMDQGVSETYRIIFADGTQGYFKPSYDQYMGHEFEHELAAYSLDRFLGFGLIPLTIGREIERYGEKVVGSLQLHHKGKPASSFKQRTKTRKLQFLDYLLGNCDRHGNNYLMDRDREVAIDNGLAFNERFCEKQRSAAPLLLTAIPKGFPSGIPSEILKKLRQTPDSVFREVLKGLTELEFAAFIVRKNGALRESLAKQRPLNVITMIQEESQEFHLIQEAHQTHEYLQQDLWKAIGDKDIQTVKKLVKNKNIDLDERDLGDETLLIGAIEGGEVGLVEALLDAGANVNLRDGHGDTPLITAIHNNRPALVKLLLDRGALRNLPSKSGIFPLDAAIKGNQAGLVQLLRDAGASQRKSLPPARSRQKPERR